MLGWMFLLDFTPAGALLAASGNVPLALAALQWLAFVAPTLNWVREKGWDWADTLRLRRCEVKWLGAGAAGGVLTWGAVTGAMALKAQLPWVQQAAESMESFGPLATSMLPAAATAAADGGGGGGALVAPAALLLPLLAGAALSPALAEELLFRGLLLTALQRRFGRVDAAVLGGAMFSAIHLSVAQFAPLTALGAACGLLTIAADSVWPAVVLHAVYNSCGLLAALAAAAAGPVLP